MNKSENSPQLGSIVEQQDVPFMEYNWLDITPNMLISHYKGETALSSIKHWILKIIYPAREKDIELKNDDIVTELLKELKDNPSNFSEYEKKMIQDAQNDFLDGTIW